MPASRKEHVLDRERRWRTPVILATILGILFVVGGQAIDAAAAGGATDRAEELVERSSHDLETILASVVRFIGFCLLTVPLVSMFISARDRTDEPIGRYRMLVAMGPPLLGLGTLLSGLGLVEAADEFVVGSPTSGDAGVERADDVVANVALGQIGAGAVYAGVLATGFGLLYTSRKGLQAGLVTHFWGTLGLAFGIAICLSFLFPGLFPVGMFGFLMWLMHAGLLTAGRWPGGRPRAWDAGVAVPWPRPGEQLGPAPGEEPARPEDFGASEEPKADAGATTASAERPGRRDNRRKRKRKQRS